MNPQYEILAKCLLPTHMLGFKTWEDADHAEDWVIIPKNEIESGLSRMLAIRFDIEHLTGKEAIELVRRHQNND